MGSEPSVRYGSEIGQAAIPFNRTANNRWREVIQRVTNRLFRGVTGLCASLRLLSGSQSP